MEQVLERCAGLDVHKAQVTACARVLDRKGRKRVEVGAEFSTMAVDLSGVARLAEGAGRHAGRDGGHRRVLESAVEELLEEDFDLILVNARHVKQVPGRKTDVLDAAVAVPALGGRVAAREFGAAEADSGSAGSNALPEGADGERQRETNRLQKVIEDAGMKLEWVASRVLGESGRRCSTRSSRERATPR